MVNKKSPPPSARSSKVSAVPPAPAQTMPKTPAAIEQADGSPKSTKTIAPSGKVPPSVPPASWVRTYDIPDYRLERPEFRIFMTGEGSNVEYRVEGDLSAAPPPIRESKYLSREQCIAIYRWMLLNRRMEVGAGESLQAGQGGWAACTSGWGRRAAPAPRPMRSGRTTGSGR